MDLGFLDSDEDNDTLVPDKYMTTDNCDTPAPTQTTETKQPDFTPVKDVIVAERPMAAAVSKIVNSPTYQILEAGQLQPAQRQQCFEVLGFAPPNLMDPQVQQQLIQRNPVLADAFQNPVMKSFANGVNESSQELCINMMLASLTSSGLDDCLRLMGRNAEGRKLILECSSKIQKGFAEVGRQTDHFAMKMADIIREVGAAATVLRYGGDVQKVLEGLETVQLLVRNEHDGFEAATLEVTAPIDEVVNFIKENLRQNDDGWREREKNMQDLKNQWLEKQNLWKEAFDVVCRQRNRLEGDIRSQKSQKDAISREIATLEEEQRQLEKRKVDVEERLQRFSQQKETVQLEEKNENESIQTEAQKWIREEITTQEKTIQDRIDALTQQTVKLVDQAAKMENASITASDGMEMVQRFVKSWLPIGRRETEMVSEQVKPNEKERLMEVASKLKKQKESLDRQINKLVEEKLRVRQKIKRDLQERSKTIRSAHLSEIETQIEYFTVLVSSFETKISETQQTLSDKHDEFEKIEARMQCLEKQYRTVDDKNVKLLQEDATRALELLRSSQADLHEHMKSLDIKNQNDYVSLIQLFNGLNTSIEALPRAVSKLSSSFEAAYRAFDGELFRTRVSQIPEENRQAYLHDLTTQLQGLCEVAWTLMQAPIRSLTLTRVESYKRFQQSIEMCTEEPSQVVIEEVADESEAGPRVEKEIQEEEKPRRR